MKLSYFRYRRRLLKLKSHQIILILLLFAKEIQKYIQGVFKWKNKWSKRFYLILKLP